MGTILTVDKQPLLDSWIMFQREHTVSVDRMICDPLLRVAFLESLGSIAATHSENEILWALMSLRKRKELSKRNSKPTPPVTKRVTPVS
ncbi:hypothetical protein Poly21_01110 [Allorhodopirellula heiligendammensis]|uniref:Uncharacterized protein n=1 Tax=Allorhodopirellula heiligendammensis TaxID=2714739 RepID=A0A5C6C581_9BACT|nr:hypothetical protein Poly21_01110 [Allorhodopirellula heiligendammensis]